MQSKTMSTPFPPLKPGHARGKILPPVVDPGGRPEIERPFYFFIRTAVMITVAPVDEQSCMAAVPTPLPPPWSRTFPSFDPGLDNEIVISGEENFRSRSRFVKLKLSGIGPGDSPGRPVSSVTAPGNYPEHPVALLKPKQPGASTTNPAKSSPRTREAPEAADTGPASGAGPPG